MSIDYKEKGKSRHHEEFRNEDVIAYLCTRFNFSALWFTVVSKSVFNNAVLAKFADVSFIINAAGTCVEIAFAKADNEKMTPVIEEIKHWEKFLKSDNSFCVKVDMDRSYSLLFESGYQPRSGYRTHFSKYELEFIDI